MWRFPAALALVLGAGCFEERLVDCGDHVCPVDYSCVAGGCRGLTSLVVCVGDAPACSGGRAIVIELPMGAQAPLKHTQFAATLRGADGATQELTGPVPGSGGIDLGPTTVDPVEIEIALRDAVGNTVGYGRTRDVTAFETAPSRVPVRGLVAYLAGPSGEVTGVFSPAPPTVIHLAEASSPSGTTQLSRAASGVTTAGANLYLADQALHPEFGYGIGPITLFRSEGDLESPPLASFEGGQLVDLAADDSNAVIGIATSEGLYAFEPSGTTIQRLAEGSFERVVVTGRSVIGVTLTEKLCMSTEELVIDGTVIASGKFVDVAVDHDRVFVLSCVGEVFEVVDGGLQLRLAVPAELRARALAVVHGRAYTLSETPDQTFILRRSDLEATVDSSELARGDSRQVAASVDHEGLQRDLEAVEIFDARLELVAGGEQVALLLRTRHAADRVPAANLPAMTFDVEEVRFFDAASGATILRYRSYCSGRVFSDSPSDILSWRCGTETGQFAPAPSIEHRIITLAFPFGDR